MRRLKRSGGSEQVTPDAMLARRGGAPCSVGKPVSEAREAGDELFTLFGSKGSRSVFDRLQIDLKLSDSKRVSPQLEWGSKIWTVTTENKDYPKSGMSKVSLFTETRKMACPSFSLPAGPTYEMGTCPAANHSKKGGLREEGKTYTCDGCVAGDTLVLVQGEGLVRIDELSARKKEFVAWSGLGWRKTRAKMTSVSPTVTVETNFGFSIRLTSDHLVKLKDGSFREAGSLEVGDRLPLEAPPRCPFPEQASLPVVISDEKSHHSEVDAHFPREWNRDIGVFLGYILGDGAISYGEYPTINLYSSSEDRGDIEKIRDFVSEWCSTKSEIKDAKEEPNQFSRAPKVGTVIKWRVKKLFEFVDGLGLNKRIHASERRVPGSIFSSSREAVAGFLSGLFSSDGSVLVARGDRDKTSVSLASVSLGLLKDVQILLFSFGIRSSICQYTTSNICRIEQGYSPLWKLDIASYDHVSLFQEKIGFFNERKKKRLSSALLSHRIRGRGRPHLCSRVTSVSIGSESEPVYDLIDVGDEHQFVGNGISVHNCYSLEGNYIYMNVALAQAVRLFWVRRSLEKDPSGALLASQLVSAIENYATRATLSDLGSRLVLELGVQMGGRLMVPVQLPEIGGIRYMPVNTPLPPESGFANTDDLRASEGVPEGAVTGFFRIHDSGDFGVASDPNLWKGYLSAWVQTATALPHVRFWAPTRMWMWKTLFREPMPPNLSVRPSSLHVDDAVPTPAGLAVGSTVLSKEMMQKANEDWGVERPGATPLWPCPVYGGKESERSCMGSGCRACWLWKNTGVAYGWH